MKATLNNFREKVLKNTTKKEIVYTMPYSTESDIKKVNDKRNKLYEKFNSVQVYPNGMYEVRIVASN